MHEMSLLSRSSPEERPVDSRLFEACLGSKKREIPIVSNIEAREFLLRLNSIALFSASC